MAKNFRIAKVIVVLLAAMAALSADGRAEMLWRTSPPDASRPDNASDPVQAQVQQVMLAMKPELKQNPAPFVRLEIPDPQELARHLRLDKQPADADPPAMLNNVSRPRLSNSPKP